MHPYEYVSYVFSAVKKSRKIRLFQILTVKVSAFSYVVVAIIALEYFPVFEFHLHVYSLVFLVFKIYFQSVLTIAFIQAGVVIRIGDIV